MDRMMGISFSQRDRVSRLGQCTNSLEGIGGRSAKKDISMLMPGWLVGRETVVWLGCLPIATADLRMKKPVAGSGPWLCRLRLGIWEGAEEEGSIGARRKAVSSVAAPEKLVEKKQLLARVFHRGVSRAM
jgi:hypothetical protein